MAKKRAKAQRRAKLARGKSAKRGKARKVAKSSRTKVAKQTIAKAKPKSTPVKKAARRMKQPVVAPAVEATVIDVIEQSSRLPA